MPDSHRSARVGGLDGIRALAVLAVMGVHQQFGWLPGGYYGVDAFFVLSGYLITTILLSEEVRTGSIALRGFWARRAKRLLPALILMVTVVGVVAAAFPSVLTAPSVPGALAALFFSSNWYYALQHVNYFSAFAQQSPLLPTWSLAIEEQFYLVWPLVLVAVLTVGRNPDRERRLRLLYLIAVFGAGLSALIMAQLAPSALGNPATAYYGTETRAQAILVGAALALGIALWGAPRPNRLVSAAGMSGLVATAIIWHYVPETSSLAFRGGFLFASLATAAIILQVLSNRQAFLTRFLSSWPLRSLGRISYGVYLWYWPVILAISPYRTHLGAYGLFGARIAVTIGIATISYFLVERPILNGAVTGRRALVAIPSGIAVALSATLLAVSAAPGILVTAPTPTVSKNRLKVLLVGDSAAGTLGVGLGAAAATEKIQLMNYGNPGCSLSMDQDIKVLWYTIEPGLPCVYGHPGILLDHWRTIVDTYNPDVVVYLARGDLFDQEIDGRWENIEERSFDTYFEHRLDQAVDILGARGATVVLLTQPYYETAETPADAWPEDQPERVERYDQIIRSFARAHSNVDVLNFGDFISPGHQFDTTVDGAVVRCSDGVHFTAAGGELAARYLLPRLLTLGRRHHQQSPLGHWPGKPPPTTPAWYGRLPCQV